MQRPRLTKELVSKINRAQDAVYSTISAHMWDEHDINEIRQILADFEANPAVWAEKHYPRKGLDFPPVMARIEKERGRLARRLARREERPREVAEVLAKLKEVEEEVLARAQRIRSTTPTFPWPQSVTVETATARAMREIAKVERQRARDTRERTAYIAKIDHQHAVEDAAKAAESLEVRRRDVALGPEHVVRKYWPLMLMKQAHAEYLRSDEGRAAQARSVAGGLTDFLKSGKATEAMEKGKSIADVRIRMAERHGQDLWEVCKLHGFPSPDTV